MTSSTRSRGFVKTVILIVVALFALAYFGFDLNRIFSRERAVEIWDTYLEPGIGRARTWFNDTF